MYCKPTVVLALTIALFGHLVAAGRTLQDQETNTDASNIVSRQLLQQYGANTLSDGSAQTITGASDLIAQAVAAGAKPGVTAAAATRGAEHASLPTADSLAGTPDTGARRLLRGSSNNRAAQSTSEPSPVVAQALVAGTQPDVRSSAIKAGADFLKLSTVDPQPLLPKEDMGAHKRSLLQRYEGNEWSTTYALNESSDVIAKAVDSGANPAVTKWATGRAAYYARLASLRGAAWSYDDTGRK